MKITELEKQLQEDLGQEIGNDDMYGLSQMAAKAPKLFIKYQTLSGHLKLKLKRQQRAFERRIAEKTELLKGKLPPEEMKAKFPVEFPGFDPHELVNTARTKAEVEKLLHSLPDIQDLKDDLEELELVVDMVDATLKQLSSFSYGIKNRIDLYKINNAIN